MKKLLIILLVAFSFTSAAQVEFNLFSEMDGVLQLEDGSTTNFWGYGYQGQGGVGEMTLPAPLLVVNQGDVVNVNFYNPSPESHTIHWHGLDVDQANDGVPSTSFFVTTGEEVTYSFNATHPGTYLYHCHVTTTIHLTMGMYGMFVVEYSDNQLFEDGPLFDNEYFFLTSDIEVSSNDDPIGAYPFHEIYPDYFMVNGKSGNQIEEANISAIGTSNENIALRLGSMAYSKVTYQFPEDLHAVVHMSDGRAIPNAYETTELEIYPGERFTVILSPEENFTADGILVEYYDMLDDELVGTNIIPFYAVGVDENEANQLNPLIYPNPTTDNISIKLNKPESVRIININGKVVGEFQLTQSDSQISVSNLESGEYMVLTSSGKLLGQFIKQ